MDCMGKKSQRRTQRQYAGLAGIAPA